MILQLVAVLEERGEVRTYVLDILLVVSMFEGHEEKVGDGGVSGIAALDDRSLDGMDQQSSGGVVPEPRRNPMNSWAWTGLRQCGRSVIRMQVVRGELQRMDQRKIRGGDLVDGRLTGTSR